MNGKLKESLEGLKKKTEDVGKRIDASEDRAAAGFGRNATLIIVLLLTLIGLFARFSAAGYLSNDMTAFILPWIRAIRETGFRSFWKVDADYSTAMMFAFAVISSASASEEGTVVMVKALSTAFDVASAVAVGVITADATGNRKKGLTAYSLFMVLPVQAVNSGVWGQCDSIWFFFSAVSLLFMLRGSDGKGWFFFGLAIGAKMQAVFFLPLFICLSACGKAKAWHSVLGVAGLFLTFIPAFACGAGLSDVFGYIGEQSSEYRLLSLGAGNVWAFASSLSEAQQESLSGFALAVGLGLIGAAMAWVYSRRKILSDRRSAAMAAIFLVSAVPFFLPFMHERYFYATECLALAWVLISGRDRAMVPLTQISGMLVYFRTLSGYESVFFSAPVLAAACINAAVLFVMMREVSELRVGGAAAEPAL